MPSDDEGADRETAFRSRCHRSEERATCPKKLSATYNWGNTLHLAERTRDGLAEKHSSKEQTSGMEAAAKLPLL